MILLLDYIMTQLSQFMLPFIRLGTMFLVMPFFGARTLPTRIRVILGIFITFLIVPNIQLQSMSDLSVSLWWLHIINQFLIGFAMGFMMQIAMSGIILAGQNVATAMGLGFASSVDPQNGIQAAVVGQIYLILGTLVFLVSDSHLFLIMVLAESFTAFPLSLVTWNMDMLLQAIFFSGKMFEIGVLIALPVLIGILLINIGLGVMTKASPQLNLFSIGFPMSMMGGFLLIYLSMPSFIDAIQMVFADVLEAMMMTFGQI
jgi:flagellar biosynthesis protein FliR